MRGRANMADCGGKHASQAKTRALMRYAEGQEGVNFGDQVVMANACDRFFAKRQLRPEHGVWGGNHRRSV